MYYSLSSASLSLPSIKKGYMGGAVKPSRGIVERYIATLKASDGGHIKLAQPIYIGANDDFEITYVFATDAPAYSVLIGNGTTRLFRIEPNGELRADCGVMNLTSTTVVNDGKLHTATIKRTGNVFSLKVDNDTELSVTNDGVLSELIFNEINKHDTSYSNVTPVELKSTSLNTLTHHYDFNVAKGTTIIPNLSQPLGSELIDFISATGRSAVLTDRSTNTVTATNNIADYGTTEQIIDLEQGVYLLQVKSSDNSAHSSEGAFTVTPNNWTDKIYHSSLQNGDNTLLFNVPSAGSYKIWFHVGTNSLGESQIFSDTSLKKAPYWAEYINVTDDNKELYTWDAERNAWIGGDVWNGNGTVATDRATSIATIKTNTTYLVEVSESIGNLQYATGAGWSALVAGENLVKVVTGTSLSVQNFDQSQSNVIFSVRELLEVAQ